MTGNAHDERRSHERHTFFAGVEIREPATRYVAIARVNEISRGGCYIDTLNPLRAATAVELLITHDGDTIALPARVVHAETSVGMGLRFDAEEDRTRLLERWIPASDV